MKKNSPPRTKKKKEKTFAPKMLPIMPPFIRALLLVLSSQVALGCTTGDATWNALATDASGTYSCGSRITWLMSASGGSLTESQAREQIVAEFPIVCANCKPSSCQDVWNAPATDSAGTFSCGSRITWLQSTSGGGKTESQARNQVAAEFPDICGPCSTNDGSTPKPTLQPTTKNPTVQPTAKPTAKPTAQPTVLTCQDVWNALATDSAGTYSCGSRITWLQSDSGGKKTETEAKNLVASEFPDICGPCGDGKPLPTSPPSESGSGGSFQSLSVVTQNLFWWNLFGQRNGGNFFNVFKRHAPFDIMLFQECDDIWYIRSKLEFPNMQVHNGAHALAIGWDGDRFQLLESGNRKVGEDQPGLWGSRAVTWVRLRERGTGRTFWAGSHHGPLPINTGGATGPENVANNIIELVRATKKDGDNVIIGGDFNADAGSRTVAALKNGNFKVHASDWVDHILTLRPNSFLDAAPETTIIYDTGSDHQGIKTVWN